MPEIDVFTAIAHPTRRQIMVLLADRRPQSLSDLAEHFGESRQAIRKHIRLLDESSLIRIERTGREQHCILQPDRLSDVNEWIEFFERHWEHKLSDLKRFVESSRDPSSRGHDQMPKKTAARKVAAAKASKKKAPESTPRKTSPVKGKTVQWYIGTLPDSQARIVSELDALVTKAAAKATSSIKWAQPVYEINGPFCFIKSAKKHVTIGFWRGAELDDAKGLLEGTGAKMRHVKIRSLDDIDKNALTKMVRQAVRLNKS